MSRWDYDTVFYRVFCITLLAVAFTFTVILTNVFVDIDGLLSTKSKAQTTTTTEPEPQPLDDVMSDVIHENSPREDKSEYQYEDKDYPDSSDLYRSKRSLAPPNRSFRIKDPQVKKLLTNHLAELLDELDNEETISENNDQQTTTTDSTTILTTQENNDTTKIPKQTKVDDEKVINEKEQQIAELKNRKEIKNKNEMKNSLNENKDEVLHLAMHNIILQGIIGSMNLDDVYTKVADLVKNFENKHNHSEANKDDIKKVMNETDNIEKNKPILQHNIVLDDLQNYKGKDKQVDFKNAKKNMIQENTIRQNIENIKRKDQNVIIKTIIDISSMANDKSNKEHINDKLNGVVKVIYNGKTIKFKRMNDDNITNRQNMNSLDKTTENAHKAIDDDNSLDTEIYNPKQNYFKKVIHDYFRRFRDDTDSSEKLISSKRLKRHIKIRYDHDKYETTTEKLKNAKTKKDDDELFVEIETHFDSKGAKGEKKKKLIRDLIEKIQKAIHSDNDDKKKKPKHWHVKKRIQNPLVSKSTAVFLNKLILPLETLAQRHIDPINKVVPVQNELPFAPEEFGQTHWLQKYPGPRFLHKSINSAEMNKLETDYSKVMSHNGIPQRLQKPLNTDISDEVLQDSNIVELGNIKFLMKDVNGTGFSVGFNQYTDEAPDTETMKLFSGLENIIQTYHQKYDLEPVGDVQQQNIYDNSPNLEQNQENGNENEEPINNNNEHLIQRRSIRNNNEPDHHTNKYKIVYSHNVLPYDNYQEIYEDKQHMTRVKSMKLFKTKRANKSALFIDENVFEKDLKPAEILSIADLFERRKRSLNVKKISNVKIKKKSNRRYLNTKSMASKKVFTDKKRNKRQIDKIRIVARDIPELHAKSDEDFFVVSDEKLFADRALVKEVDIPEETHKDKIPVDHYDVVPQKEEDLYESIAAQPQKENDDNYDIMSPYIYEVSPFESKNEFTRRARHNSLMAKYPHIILDETHRSFDSADDIFPDNYYIEASTVAATPTIVDKPIPNEKEMVELAMPPKDSSNYRVTVKIRPKNTTGMSGFKEVHTSINKSYKKNGLMYTSLVNVSQVSKVENMNKTISRRRGFDLTSSAANLKQQQEVVKALIKQHKRRLDNQLRQLQIEREKLDTMNMETQDILLDKMSDAENVANSKNMLQIAQEEARKLFDVNFPTTTPTTTITPTTTTTTTKYYPPQTSDDTIKIKMINSIERNENITNELLRKIDQNTGVLKTFLGQLIANIEPTRKNNAQDKIIEENVKNEEKSTINNNQSNNKQDIINHGHNFEDYQQHIPHLFFRNQRITNNSLGIPFVYAYQQPYVMTPSKESSIASVVYHGHIHTNGIGDSIRKPEKIVKEQNNEKKKSSNGGFWKPKPGEKVIHDFVIQNNTKFFIDDNDSHAFKVISMNDHDKNIFNTGLGDNSTKV